MQYTSVHIPKTFNDYSYYYFSTYTLTELNSYISLEFRLRKQLKKMFLMWTRFLHSNKYGCFTIPIIKIEKKHTYFWKLQNSSMIGNPFDPRFRPLSIFYPYQSTLWSHGKPNVFILFYNIRNEVLAAVALNISPLFLCDLTNK